MSGRLLSLAAAAALAAAACSGGAVPRPTAAHLERARAENADATLRDLERGRDLFVSRCSGCHTLPAPADHGPAKWTALVAEMAERAELDAGEAHRVTQYLRAAARR